MSRMVADEVKGAYQRARAEIPSIGVLTGGRSQPTLEEARVEFAKQISRSIDAILKDRYGPLIGVFSETAIIEFLKSFESGLSRTKGDATLVAQELIDRVLPPNQNSRKKRDR